MIDVTANMQATLENPALLKEYTDKKNAARREAGEEEQGDEAIDVAAINKVELILPEIVGLKMPAMAKSDSAIKRD